MTCATRRTVTNPDRVCPGAGAYTMSVTSALMPTDAMLSTMRRLEPLWFSWTGRCAFLMTRARWCSSSTFPRAVEDSQRVSGRAVAADAGASLKARGQVGWSKTVFKRRTCGGVHPPPCARAPVGRRGPGGFCPHGRPGPLGFGLRGRFPRHGVGGLVFNSLSSPHVRWRSPLRKPAGHVQHVARTEK